MVEEGRLQQKSDDQLVEKQIVDEAATMTASCPGMTLATDSWLWKSPLRGPDLVPL
jgi:hypothetical protein